MIDPDGEPSATSQSQIQRRPHRMVDHLTCPNPSRQETMRDYPPPLCMTGRRGRAFVGIEWNPTLRVSTVAGSLRKRRRNSYSTVARASAKILPRI
jgi:hypothetical protein